jgi:hypothetical protein
VKRNKVKDENEEDWSDAEWSETKLEQEI